MTKPKMDTAMHPSTTADNHAAQNLKAVQSRITKAIAVSNRNINSVQLLAVSKTQTAKEVQSVAEAGQIRFGENYLQDALPKIEDLKKSGFKLEWHYIGPIQSNKTRAIAEHFQWVHSVDRIKIAQRLNEQRSASLEPLNICIQVNIGHETQKAGIQAEALNELAKIIIQLPQLKLRGLMAIPPANANIEQQHAAFAELRMLYDKLPSCESLDTLSMGMSDDLEIAIAEGATMVRVGTAIFGARK